MEAALDEVPHLFSPEMELIFGRGGLHIDAWVGAVLLLHIFILVLVDLSPPDWSSLPMQLDYVLSEFILCNLAIHEKGRQERSSSIC